MKRIVLVLLLAISVRPASAHVGSPDIFFEGDAGPYHLFVTIRPPDVIPGVASIEIRSSDADATAISVVPLRLTGPGSELPPTPDLAVRSAEDPQFFVASLWLMEHGSLQVRIAVDGARGPGKLAVPVPAVAQRTLPMTIGLGALLLGLMLVLGLGLVAIIAGAIREGTLDGGVLPAARNRRRARIATLLTGAGVVALVAFGNLWWSSEAATYEQFVAKPWRMSPHLIGGCELWVTNEKLGKLMLDHEHEMHLFVVRVPQLDRLAHLHPHRLEGGQMAQQLPSLPGGHYQLFADVVFPGGFPVTGIGEIDLPDMTCDPLTGDDATWSGSPAQTTTVAELGEGARMIWVREPTIHANVAVPLQFRVENRDGSAAALEPYMGMAGHAAIVRTDMTVFAHLHPAGSVAMPALDLARASMAPASAPPDPHAGHMMHAMALPPRVTFPYGFPQAGNYRLFIQVKLAGRIETGVFDVVVEP